MNTAKKLFSEVERLNRRYGLLERGDRVIVAVSGGPDSMALLFLLAKMSRRYRLHLAVAHLNHGLNARDARRYETLTERAAGRLGLPFYAKRIHLRSIARKSRRSLEDAGRLERYRFFESVARRFRARKIATAHTLDDQAETVLLRLFRGTGLRGLAGIPALRSQRLHLLVRPLLGSRKKDLRAFLKEEGIRYCADKTNKSRRFTRNRVRWGVLPSLRRRFNPQIEQSLADLAAMCAETQAYLDAVAERAFKACLQKSVRGKVTLRLGPLRRLPAAVQANTVLRALREKTGALKRFTHEHVQDIVGLVRARRKGLELHLPGGLRITKPAPDRLDISRS